MASFGLVVGKEYIYDKTGQPVLFEGFETEYDGDRVFCWVTDKDGESYYTSPQHLTHIDND